MAANGSIVGTDTLVDNGDPQNRFDIVILAEGFQEGQLGLFDRKARTLARELLKMPPFDEVASLINIHTVRTISTDSGLSRFPRRQVNKKTFYNVEGHFEALDLDETPKSFLGTHTPHVVLRAAERVAPLQALELFIVLCNVKALAASAFPDLQMVFTGLHQDDTDLVHYTAHECCHAIARTAEEYLDCDGPTPGRSYRNQVTEAQRKAGKVWWKKLCLERELDSKGAFKAVHLQGDPNVRFRTILRTPVFVKEPSLNGMLGLYWGCQDTDPTKGTCDQLEDKRGRHYYRGMATCKMRTMMEPFCRVCSYLMIERIQAATL